MNFMAIRRCVDLGTARVKALGWLKKEKEDDKTHLQVCHFNSLNAIGHARGLKLK